MEDEAMEEASELLVTRRSKRSTAGNRMEAALAEMALDDANKELDDDNDFVNDKDEEDIFGSDFESTDEEAEKQVIEAGENEVVQEERIVKKAARTRLEKITAAAHAKNKASFNPDIQITTTVKSKPKAKLKLRFAMGATVDAESREMSEVGGKDIDGKTRTSQRKHTIQNTSATVTRLKQSQAKRASQPKKAKVEYKTYTQGELIALALDTEEGNIVDHRDYLKNEAEKRKRARVVRTAVEGPLLRWISRKEEAKVLVPPPPPPPPPPPSVPAPTPVVSHASSTSIFRSVYGPPGSLFTPTTYSYTAGMTIVSTNASTSTPQPQSNMVSSTYPQTTTSFSHYQPYPEAAFPTWPPPASTQQSTSVSAPISATSAVVDATRPSQNVSSVPPIPQAEQKAATSDAEPPTPPEPEYRLETVTKNYLVHELAQHKGTPKPSWADSMQAMFGDHVKWDQVKVFVGKNRPLSRPRQICQITGRQAHYLDPRSGVPYANSHAYKTLTTLLKHQYVWSPSLGCYLNREKNPSVALDSGKQATGAESGDGMNVDGA